MKGWQAVLMAAVLAAGSLVQAEEVKIEHEGLTLNANWKPVGESWREGPVILMTHGTLAHGRMEIMDTLQQLFPDYGISSLSITLSLGLDDRRGMYDCATPHRHKHTDALDEIGVWLNWLKEQGAQQVVLLGHSRGGNQTAWFAAERDEAAIAKVVLIAPATWNEQQAAADYEKKYGMTVAKLRAKAEAATDDELLEVPGFIYCKDTRASAAAIRSYYRPDPRLDTPYLLTRQHKPVLVIAGTDDQAVPGLPERLDGKDDFELVVIDGADHFFRDLYADEVVEAVQSFLEAE